MENVENKLVKISVLTMVISIVLVLIVMFVFAKPVFVLALAVLYMSNLQSILLLVSGLIIIAGAVYITYRYLLYMINHFKTKKIKTIFMAIIPIVLLIILGIIYKTEETFSLVIGIPSIYIFTVIVIPIIVIGMILLRDMKTIKKVIAATIIAILTIGIYIIHYPYLKLCAEELSYSSKTWEKTKAVEAVYITLKSKSIALMHAISPYIKTMYDAIIKNHFTIDNTNQDDKILKGMSSSNDEEKLKSTLTCLYKLRCNLIHGDKEYMEEQRTILTAANKCLEILNQELYLSLKN